ncbi:hypothetical protein DSM110093_03685 (plasmid) [Sulfitobacter sp. DSM 110093]|nr:hypothetical protein DSM110093_03685 [Sulfitobacter sp. DSM 110093]
MKKLQAMSFRSGEPKRHFDSILRMIERTALPKQTCFLNAFWKLDPTANLWVQYHAKKLVTVSRQLLVSSDF